MAELLRRKYAPITEAAWNEIDASALDVLKPLLSARTVVDFNGPHGWEMAAVNLGCLELPKKQETEGVEWGKRCVLPLVEFRTPFQLDQWELDNLTRGAAAPDLGALEQAARTAAKFEENFVYNGFAGAGVKGILAESPHKPITLGSDSQACAKAVTEAVQSLQEVGIAGPYALVLGDAPYRMLMHSVDRGYPLYRVINNILGGPIKWSSVLQGGVLLSMRGGDFELTVGKDLSIGFTRADGRDIHLYITESLTFRALEPAAAVPLKA